MEPIAEEVATREWHAARARVCLAAIQQVLIQWQVGDIDGVNALREVRRLMQDYWIDELHHRMTQRTT